MISDIFATRIWGMSNGSSASYTLKINIPNKTVTAVASISKVEFSDDDDHSWAKVSVQKYCYYNAEDFVLCPLGTSQTSYKKINNAANITFQLEVRNDDGFVYADCPILIFFHN